MKRIFVCLLGLVICHGAWGRASFETMKAFTNGCDSRVDKFVNGTDCIRCHNTDGNAPVGAIIIYDNAYNSSHRITSWKCIQRKGKNPEWNANLPEIDFCTQPDNRSQCAGGVFTVGAGDVFNGQRICVHTAGMGRRLDGVNTVVALQRSSDIPKPCIVCDEEYTYKDKKCVKKPAAGDKCTASETGDTNATSGKYVNVSGALKCVPSACKDTYKVENNKCVVSKKKGDACTDAELKKINAKTGKYNSSLKCVATECLDGFLFFINDKHQFQGYCHAKSARESQCAKSGKIPEIINGDSMSMKCVDKPVEPKAPGTPCESADLPANATAGTYDANKKCVATECVGTHELTDGKCVEKIKEEPIDHTCTVAIQSTQHITDGHSIPGTNLYYKCGTNASCVDKAIIITKRESEYEFVQCNAAASKWTEQTIDGIKSQIQECQNDTNYIDATGNISGTDNILIKFRVAPARDRFDRKYSTGYPSDYCWKKSESQGGAPINFTLKFNAGGAQGTVPADIACNSNKDCNLPNPTELKMDAKEFDQWQWSAHPDMQLIAGTTFPGTRITTEGATIELTAVWRDAISDDTEENTTQNPTAEAATKSMWDDLYKLDDALFEWFRTKGNKS